MGKGFLRVQATAGGGAVPVSGAEVIIRKPGGEIIHTAQTDADGNAGDFGISAPTCELTFSCMTNMQNPPYSTVNVEVRANGFIEKYINSVQVIDAQTVILPVNMEPIVDEPNPNTRSVTQNPPPGPTFCEEYRKTTLPPRARDTVIIPEYIIVHLGRPAAAAKNVRIRFADYVKNVASSEIYATWPLQSLRANIHAIVTFALNRVFT